MAFVGAAGREGAFANHEEVAPDSPDQSATLPQVLLLLSAFALAKKEPPPPAWRPGDATKADVKTGNDAMLQARPAEALLAYQRALSVEPRCGQCLVGAGKALLAEGKAADALVPLSQAATLFPTEIETHAHHARGLWMAGRADDAFAAAKAALAIKPAHVEAHLVAQAVLRSKKDYATAHAMLAEARILANIVAFDCLDGLAWAEEGKLDEAKKAWEACQFMPDERLTGPLKTALGQ